MSFQKSETEVFSGGECGEEEIKEEEEKIAFVSLNVCLESECFSTKVSKDPSRNAWDPCPAELKNRLCMKCNPPALCGIWQVFTATLIQEYLVLSVLSSTHLSPWHTVTYRLHTLHWQAPGNCLQNSQRCAVPSIGLRSFHSFSPLPEALPPACISPLRTNCALREHCSERRQYYPAWVGNHMHTGHNFHLCWTLKKDDFKQVWVVLPLTLSKGKQIPQISK